MGAALADLGPASEALRQAFIDHHPQEAAHSLEAASAEEVRGLLERETPARGARLLKHLIAETAADSLRLMSAPALARLLPATEPLHMSSVLARLDADDQERILSLIDEKLANEFRQLMSYPEDTAGSIMDPRVTSFPADLTAEEVLAQLHVLRERRIRDLFVVDEGGRLAGAVPLHEVIIADPDRRLGEVSRGRPPCVGSTAPLEEAIDALTESRLSTLPVVDIEGRLIGVIRQPEMVQAAQEEAVADMQTMVGAGREERALSSPTLAIARRLPWLNINLLTAFLAAAVVGLFENTIARFTALAVLLPVVAGQSGNTGAQALAVTMRGLALREVRRRHWPRVVLKEATASLVNGLAIALVAMIAVYVWSGSTGLSGVIGGAMVISMVMASVAGTVIPMGLTAFGQDPAHSSSIILTTVTDVVGFFTFLGLATLFAAAL